MITTQRFSLRLLRRSFAIFLSVQELLKLEGAGQTVDKLPEQFKALSVFDTRYWVPDVDIVKQLTISINTIDEIVPTLEVTS